jgi:hypothetical protein
LTYYFVNDNAWRVEEKINKKFKSIEESIHSLTPATTPAERELLYSELFANRCGANKINIDIIEGKVNGVSISDSLQKILSANTCLSEDEKTRAIQDAALGKGWTIRSPLMKIFDTNEMTRLPKIMFASSGFSKEKRESKEGHEDRRFIFVGTRYSGNVSGFAKMSLINVTNLEKMFGKPVYKSENDTSIWTSESPSKRVEKKVQKLYKTKYGCLSVVFTEKITDTSEESAKGKMGIDTGNLWFDRGTMQNTGCDSMKEGLQKVDN